MFRQAPHPASVDTVQGAMKTIDEQLDEALAKVKALEGDAQANAQLLEESQIQVESLKAERDQLSADLNTAKTSIKSLSERNAALEAAEKDIEKRAAARAAEIVASTGTTTPAKVSPAGDSKAQDIFARFKAITNPAEQTAFWRKLSPEERALLLNLQPEK